MNNIEFRKFVRKTARHPDTAASSAHMDRLWADHKFRAAHAKRSSARMKKLWQDPKYREKMKGRKHGPTD